MLFPDLMRIGVPELGFGFAIAMLMLWLVVSFWAYRDMGRRSRSVGWAVASFLLVLLLPVIGLIIYLFLRPPETLMAVYDRALDQELKLQQIERNLTCPGCSRPIQPDWIVCPECHVTLHRLCTHCGVPLELHWQICPVCAHVVEPASWPVPEPIADT